MPGFKVYEKEYPYFLTITVIEWLPIFLSKPYLDIVVQSLKYYQREKGLFIYGYVIMPDHIHLIVSVIDDLLRIIGYFKSFTSHKILDLMKIDNRRLYLWLAKDAGRKGGESEYKIWQEGFHPEQIYSQEFFEQKLNYIHDNPVRRGLVVHPADWLHSSAGYYYERDDIVLNMEPLSW